MKLLLFFFQDNGDKNPGGISLSNTNQIAITILDGDDLGPYFLYTTCPDALPKICARPKYTTSIQSGQVQVSLWCLIYFKHSQLKKHDGFDNVSVLSFLKQNIHKGY